MGDTMYSWQQVAKVMREFFGMGDMAEEILRLRDENAALRAENTALTAAVERVRALHHNRMRGAYACAECRDDYPCPTLRALEVGRE